MRPETYVGASLSQQLENYTRLFLTDKSRNYFNDDHLYVSSIFDWYREDFENVLGVDSVCQVLESYKEQLGVRLDSKFCLQTDDIKLDYLDHDWSLNRVFFD